MLPTVEYIDDFKNSLEPTADRKPTKPQSPNLTSTRFLSKPDPRKDLAMRQQCEGKQQPRQAEDGDGVCDLNRYSSTTPPSLNVYDQRRVQISTAGRPSLLLPPLLLLSSSNEMAFDKRTEGTSTISASVGDIFRGRSQIALVTLIRQLSYLTTHADAIFHSLSTDITRIFEHGQRLKSRLETLEVHADSLLGKKAAKPGATGLILYTNIKKHFETAAKDEVEDKDRGYGLFTPASRPSIIRTLYDASEVDPMKKRTLSSSLAVEHCATQTDDTGRSRTTQSLVRLGTTLAASQSNNGDEPSTEQALPTSMNDLVRQEPGMQRPANVRTRSENKVDGPTIRDGISGDISIQRNSGQTFTPTSVLFAHSAAKAHEVGTVVDIRTSGAAFSRKSNSRKSDYGEILRPSNCTISPDQNMDLERIRVRASVQSRRGRRNTIGGFEAKPLEKLRYGETSCRDFCGDQTSAGQEEIACRIVGTTGESIANDVIYEFAPFQRRKNKHLLAPTNFFSSLRRSKKDKRIISTPIAASTPDKIGALKIDANGNLSVVPTRNERPVSTHRDSMKSTSSDDVSAGTSRANRKVGTSSAIRGIKQLFQRSGSLRRPKSGKRYGANDSVSSFGDPSSPISVQHEIGSGPSIAGLQRKPKTILPISTTSQVIDLAAQLRDNRPSPLTSDTASQSDANQRFSKLSSSSSRDSAYSSCGKKFRPASIVSNASLDFAESKVNGWYRQGYQLEYPDECVQASARQPNSTTGTKSVPTVPSTMNSIVKTAARLPVHQSTSRGTSNSSPYSESSSFVDSNFSCDREGYFTTMHRDCGLEKDPNGSLSGSVTSRPHYFTPAPRDHNADVESSKSSINTVTERIGAPGVVRHQLSSTRCPANESHKTFLQPRHRPPDLSLPPSIHMATPFSTLSPSPMSAASEAEIKFDLWLMSKFHAEQRMQHYMQQQKQHLETASPTGSERSFARNFGRFSLPRFRKNPNKQQAKNQLVQNYLRTLACGSEQHQREDTEAGVPSTADYSSTITRKTVRFCE